MRIINSNLSQLPASQLRHLLSGRVRRLRAYLRLAAGQRRIRPRRPILFSSGIGSFFHYHYALARLLLFCFALGYIIGIRINPLSFTFRRHTASSHCMAAGRHRASPLFFLITVLHTTTVSLRSVQFGSIHKSGWACHFPATGPFRFRLFHHRQSPPVVRIRLFAGRRTRVHSSGNCVYFVNS